MPPELSSERQQQEYDKLVLEVKDAVQHEREAKGYGSKLWSQIKAAVRVQVHPSQDTKLSAVHYANVVAQVSAVATFALPLVGGIVRKAVAAGLDTLENHMLKGTVERSPKPATLFQQAQWLAHTGAADIEASLVKLETAQKQFNEVGARGLHTCDDMAPLLHSFYEFRHRHERLRARTEVMQRYADALMTELNQLDNELATVERLMAQKIPPAVFGSWRWHANCLHGQAAKCLYPWESVEAAKAQLSDLSPTHGVAPLDKKAPIRPPDGAAMRNYLGQPVKNIPPPPPLKAK